MISFKKLEKNIEEITPFLNESEPYFCDLTVGTRYIWGDVFTIYYAIFDKTLILKESGEGYEDAFYFPIGKNVNGALKEIEKYCLKNFIPLNYCCLKETELNYLKKRYYFTQDYYERDWSDYVYLAQTFKDYKGKKLSAKRNHVNKFLKLYPNFTVEEASENNLKDILEFLKEYGKKDGISEYEKSEIINLKDYVNNFAKLNQKGLILKVEEKVIGISFGERTKDTLTVHVEKADTSFEGAYPMLAKQFALTFATDGVNYINREEDCGDEGLRISKTRYCPIEIRHKYVLKVKTLFDKIIPPINIEIDNELFITDVKEEHKKELFALSTDSELNKWWGYDYKEDLKEELSLEYFINFIMEMKQKKEEYSLSVTKNGKMVGELVLHNFDYFGRVEMGFRFLREEQKKGYAFKSASALKDFVKNTLNARVLKSRCFKENQASFKLIKRLGLNKKGESRNKFYFSVNL